MQYKMNKEHKKNYLKGLRSEEYWQISGSYHESSQGDLPCVCAVGLYLCQINGVERVEDACKDGDTCSLDFGWIPRNKEESDIQLIDDIISLNDEEEYTFEQIADWIEENVEGV